MEYKPKQLVFSGLLAGIVLNFGEFLLNQFILGAEWAAVFDRFGLSPVSTSGVIVFLVLTVGIGILMMWVYSMALLAYQRTASAALTVGLLFWILLHVYPSAWLAGMGIFPGRMLLAGVIWGLGEVVLAALVGAWYYNRTWN